MKKIILLVLFFCCLQITYAQPGSLDPSFGNNGIVTADLGSPYNYSNMGRQVLLQPDGSMYLVIQVDFATVIAKKHADGSTDLTYGNGGLSATVPIFWSHAILQTNGKIVIVGDFAVARFDMDGSLDNTFDGDGILATPFTANSLALQSDGKIVIAGGIGFPFGDNPQYFTLARYNTDGSLDSTFGTSGRISTDIGFGNEVSANAVTIQGDGKIVATGNVWRSSGYSDFVLVRYNINGSLDSTFSSDGIQITDMGSSNDVLNSMVIQSDGKILVSGSTDDNFVLVRYNADGSLDNTFDGDGIQTNDFGSSQGNSISVAIQIDGKIIIAGNTKSTNKNDFAIARYNINGSLDTTFDIDGKLTSDFSASDDYTNSIAIGDDGKLVVLGYTINGPNTNTAVARYNTNGNLDNTFDEDGQLVDHINQGNTYYKSIAIQSDGKILAAGHAWNGSSYDFALVRYNTDGSFDDTFSSDGKQMTDFGSSNDYANSIAIQSDGKIVVAGSAGDDFALARYNTDGSLDNTFDNDGLQITDFGSSDYVAKIVIQSDGKIVAGGSVLARYNIDGSLDLSFGDNGKVIISDPAGDSESNYCNDIVVQNDGKIVIVAPSEDFIMVARFNSDGSVDNTFEGTFGYRGFTLIGVDEFESYLRGNSILVQNDGKIVVGGYHSKYGKAASEYESYFALIRLNTNGHLDSAFNNGGIVYTPTIRGAKATSAKIQGDNKIILAGYGYNGTSIDFMITRYNTDGSLDSSFSSDGIQMTQPSGANDSIAAIAIAGNQLYVAGSGQFPTNFGVVARYLLDDNNPIPPAISLITPAHDTTYTAYGYIKVTLNAVASDVDGTISKVDFYSNNTLLHTEFVAPYGYIWHNVAAGNYTITAKATDNYGNVTTSNAVHITVVPDIAPTVNITSPANGASYIAYSNITLSADANDVDGTVKKVDFYNGSTLIFTETVAPYERKGYRLPVGNYLITAKATDNDGRATTSAPVAISVVDNIAPVVSITSPANNTTYVAPATIILSADASDVDGTIKKVDFYNGSTLFHTENIAPYEFRLGYIPTGSYTFTAKATDNTGKTTTSAPVAISVVSAGKPMAAPDKLSSSKESVSLNLNPNPVANILNISVHGLQTNNRSTISILSVSGAVIKTIQPGALNKNVQLDVSSLSGGVYFIKVINGDKILYKQFVKL